MAELATITVENNLSFKYLEDGRTEISFITDKAFKYKVPVLKEEVANAKADKLTIKVSKFRKSRSINANNYLWVMISELANVQKLPKEEVYRHYIKDYGQYRTYEIPTDAVDTMAHVWNAYGLGWIVEKVDDGERNGFSLVNFYYGSSCYNTKRMARLIDAVVEDCKDQGIETLTPDELRALKEAWKVER